MMSENIRTHKTIYGKQFKISFHSDKSPCQNIGKNNKIWPYVVHVFHFFWGLAVTGRYTLGMAKETTSEKKEKEQKETQKIVLC